MASQGVLGIKSRTVLLCCWKMSRRQWRQTWRLGLTPLPFYHKDEPLLQCNGMLRCSLARAANRDQKCCMGGRPPALLKSHNLVEHVFGNAIILNAQCASILERVVGMPGLQWRCSFRTSRKRADAATAFLAANLDGNWRGEPVARGNGSSAMSTPIADVRFLRGVFASLVFTTGMCVAGLVYALLLVPSPPAGMTISFLP